MKFDKAEVQRVSKEILQKERRRLYNVADALIDRLQQNSEAPCLRDDLQDNREWVRIIIMEMLASFVTGVVEGVAKSLHDA